MYRLCQLFFYTIYSCSEIIRQPSNLQLNTIYLKRQELVRKQSINNITLSFLNRIFSIDIKYLDIFQSRSAKEVITAIFTFLLPEKKYIPMEDIVNQEEGKRALNTYNEYIYQLGLLKLIKSELEEKQQILDQLRLASSAIDLYDELVKQEQEIRGLEMQLINLQKKILEAEINFEEHCLYLFKLPEQKQKRYFILPIKTIDITKILYYVNYSFQVQKAYWDLKEANENIHDNFKLSYKIQNKDQNMMEISYDTNLHLDETIKQLHYILQITYYQTFFRAHNAYLTLLALKEMIHHEQQSLEIIEERIEKFSAIKDINFFLKIIEWKKKRRMIKRKILELQFKQAQCIGIIVVTLVPLNHMKYMYYYEVLV